jgi:hypothetical protein
VVQEGEQTEHDHVLASEVVALRAKRTLRTLATVQDLSDALLALNDVRGEGGSESLAGDCSVVCMCMGAFFCFS